MSWGLWEGFRFLWKPVPGLFPPLHPPKAWYHWYILIQGLCSYGALDFGDNLSLVGFVLARGLYGVGAFGGHGCRIFAVFPGRKIAAVEVQDGIFVFSAYLPYFFRRYSVVLPYWRSDKGTLLP